MPLIHIHLREGKSPKYIQAIADGVHKTLVKTWKIPKTDRFHMISEHKKNHFHFNKVIWGVKRSDDVVVIYITSIKRSAAMKKLFYKEIVKTLAKSPKIRPEDVFVSIVTVGHEDWSFGNGIAQLLDPSQKP